MKCPCGVCSSLTVNRVNGGLDLNQLALMMLRQGCQPTHTLTSLLLFSQICRYFKSIPIYFRPVGLDLGSEVYSNHNLIKDI